MTSYFSSITSSSAISNLGTRLNSLRRAITLGDEADDPDDENCSHISNVLRAYYAEKGRPYPAWLPPDPKAPPPAPARIVATTQIQPGANSPAASAPGYGRNSGGGLGDLWGDSASAQPPPPQTSSLRRARGGALAPPLNSAASAPPGSVVGSPPGPSPSGSPSLTPTTLHPQGARPLPSQGRSGSYQPGMQPPLERAASAQDRLRMRLHGGGRSPSPAQTPTGSRPGSPYVGGEAPTRKPVGGRFR